ncbi:MAG TPA: AbrB family transcriptional regulator [Casimicrobiaceae bacterium]|nr:AbrB family transcriptional regulator [Casimicrobiaceae bacterium]
MFRALAALAIGATAGYACSLLHTPIPWMLGPLFSLAILRVAGVDIGVPTPVRYGGQWLIGTALGLYFTPQVVREVAGLWYLLLAGAVFAVAVGYVSALALTRMTGLDRTTALFASVPGGAAEMAVLGERFGARVDRVAAAQSLRMLIVVAVIPAAYTLLGVHGADPYVQGAKAFEPVGFVILLAATGIGGIVFQRFRLPNAFVLGSLAVAIPLTALEIDLSSMPQVASNVGQCLLGCALGSRFQRDFLKGAHRFVGAVLVSVMLAMALSALFGAGTAYAAGLHPATLVLGTAPGGIAEMCITAKVLRLGVPLVTAFHVARVVVILLTTVPVFARVRQRWNAGENDGES